VNDAKRLEIEGFATGRAAGLSSSAQLPRPLIRKPSEYARRADHQPLSFAMTARAKASKSSFIFSLTPVSFENDTVIIVRPVST
jgi:hypothetical protein